LWTLEGWGKKSIMWLERGRWSAISNRKWWKFILRITWIIWERLKI
jgi:hypothetical protein